MIVLERVKLRIGKEEVEDKFLDELISTVSDRLCLRLSEKLLPEVFESICVDAVIKMYRKVYYEGINSEGSEGISTSFVDDVLSEYDSEVTSWKEARSNKSAVVKFL